MGQNQAKSIWQRFVERLAGDDDNLTAAGTSGVVSAALTAEWFRNRPQSMLVITETPEEGRRFADDLRFFLSGTSGIVLPFSAYNVLPFSALSYHGETAAKRIRVLYRLVEDRRPYIVVAPVAAVLQQLIPKTELADFAELVLAGEDIDRDQLVGKLVAGGYQRAVVVEEPGDFCVRGGIIDIYSPQYSHPIRLELFGDQVDSLRFFDPVDQTRRQDIEEAVVLPAREALLTEQRLSEVISRLRLQASLQEMPVTQVRDLVDGLRRESAFPGIDSQLSLVYAQLDSLLDYLPAKAPIVLVEPEAVEQSTADVLQRVDENRRRALDQKRLCVETRSLYLDWPSLSQMMDGRRIIRFKSLPTGGTSGDGGRDSFTFTVQDNETLRAALKHQRGEQHSFQPLYDRLIENRQYGLTTAMVCPQAERGSQIAFLLSPYGLEPERLDAFSGELAHKGRIVIVPGELSAGFISPEAGLAVIAEHELFGRRRRRRVKSAAQEAVEQIAYSELKQGDLIVHSQHGIGRYEGLVKIRIEASTNDYLLIVYRDDDRLYLPVDRIRMVQKYVGVDGVDPMLDKMGGKSWERVKAKVKKSVEKMAADLLQLYARRKVEKGFRFSRVDGALRSFEDGFAYEETPDQLKAIEEVAADMEAAEPMDRLVCGDVGYGKTEVALRASFKAVLDGKQVAMLVPTTVLAEQHYATFADRFEAYPVNLACLSRFRSAAEQRSIINRLKNGQIDIVIGTHRLIQKDVNFKDLGLIVIDEEQRFGVSHKEKLKRLRRTVDVLALTATPIPRTLHLSLTGVRDISIIATPPEYRQSIITYISEFDDDIIIEAVERERQRGGQIFFIHNQVHNIWTMANYLRQLVPQCRIAAAHGQMAEKELEKVMVQFVKHEIDMLVCTTIVESGLDIPSANTIIVNRADRFGLAQMYQLRGRVGRSAQQAFAYLFIPKESRLTRDARKRLKVLMEHSQMGAGFQIAMSDLRIRGGGNLLGAAQSGQVAAVGYETFLHLMENAMAELKGETVVEALEPEINIPLSAFLPEDYLPEIDERMMIYRRLSRLSDLKGIADFKQELADRFGPLPSEVANLLMKIMLRVLCIRAGVARLDLVDQRLVLSFSQPHLAHPEGLVALAVQRPDMRLTPDQGVVVDLKKKEGVNGLMGQVKNILQEISQRVTG